MAAQVFIRSGSRPASARHERRRAPGPARERCTGAHADPARLAPARDGLVGPAAALRLAETFRLLGDPTRVRLLDALSGGELCVCDLAALVDHSVSAVSHQLRLLRGLRLVRTRRAGRRIFYALDDEHIVDLLTQARRHVEEGQRPGAADRAGSRRRAGTVS